MLPSPTPRLRFREMTVDDLDPLSAVLGAPDPVRPTRTPRTRADTERWIAWNQDNYRTYGFGLWVIETHDGRFVGDCGLTMQDIEGEQHLEVGYHVALDLRGRGLASEAAAAVRRAATAARRASSGRDHPAREPAVPEGRASHRAPAGAPG